MSRLKEVIISITNRCNSSCRMCDIPKQLSPELSTRQWERVIEDISAMNVPTVVFSGGEPLLREDIFRLISFAKDKGLNVCIASNGILINDAVAEKLSGAGIDVVNISIEGPKRIHDYLRGDSSFDKAKNALENLRAHNVETTLATVISHYNYKYLDYAVNLANECGATTIKFQPFNVLFIKDKSRGEDFFISWRESQELKQIVKEIASSCDKYGIATNPCSYLEKVPYYMNNKNLKGSNGCKALWSSCPINCNGDIYPCWVLSGEDYIVGNVKEKRISDIWNSQRQNLVREKITNQGCPGCMMSCYDESFGRDSIEKKITLNAKRIKKQGFLEYARCFFIRLVKRFKFYSSYRGSFKSIAARAGRIFKKRRVSGNKLGLSLHKEEINKSLQQIAAAKEMLRKETIK